MKILMLEPGGWGGICHYSYNLCRALSERGCEVVLLTGTPYELAHLPHPFRVEAAIPAGIPHAQKWRHVAAQYLRHRPNILHIQSTFSMRKDWLSAALLRLLRIPMIYTVHNVLPHDESERAASGMMLSHRLFYGFARHLIVHSRDSRSTLERRFGPKHGRVTVIPHGNYLFAEENTAQTSDEARRRLALPQTGRIILAFGAIRAYKGVDDLLDAFARVAHQDEAVSLVIAGKPIGQSPECYARRISELGLTDRVYYRPEYVPLDEIPLYFGAADIAVYPYRSIYQSGALQLAYAFAKPVLATRVGAFPETVDDGINGRIVSPDAPEQLAGALGDLLSLSDAELHRMGNHSRTLAKTRYSWTTIAEQTTELYRALSYRPHARISSASC